MRDGAVWLLDNKDSFVWNLAQAFWTLGTQVHVVRSDQVTVAELRLATPAALVLSPGPGGPKDAGICIQAVRELCGTLPILGVCLGHQAIGAAFGGRIERGTPCHGKAWPIHHEHGALYRGLPQPLTACRYHSLVVREPLPDVLRAEAWTPQGELMGLSHRTHPTFGVQFHPESFRTEHGLVLLRNFLAHVHA